MDESVYPHVSRPISAAAFKRQCLEIVGAEELCRAQEDEGDGLLDEELGIPPEVCHELQLECDNENFQGPSHKQYDATVTAVAAIPFPEDIELNTLRATKRRACKIRDSNYIPHRFKKEELADTDGEEDQEDQASGDNGTTEKIAADDVLLLVTIFHPETRKKTLEFLVLHSQSLSDLKDTIDCPSGTLPAGNLEITTPAELMQKSKDVYKSGYFFIEGVFYNDMRDPLNRDLSRVIIDWAKSSSRYQSSRLGVFSSARMEDTVFGDLDIRLGYPYLYCHQGNCKHIITFTDMRCADPADEQAVASYPLQTFLVAGKRKVCPVCETYTTSWVTYNDMLAFEDPAFFCSTCFDYLHFSEDKKRLYDFEAYPYEGMRW